MINRLNAAGLLSDGNFTLMGAIIAAACIISLILYAAHSESAPGALFLCLESEKGITKSNQYLPNVYRIDASADKGGLTMSEKAIE